MLQVVQGCPKVRCLQVRHRGWEWGGKQWHCPLLHSHQAIKDLFPELFVEHILHKLTLHKLQSRINEQMKKMWKMQKG